MIRVITITHQCGSGGTTLARLLAHKLGWNLVDRGLIERVARVTDLDTSTAEYLDEQATRWCGVLKARGINLDTLCSPVVPRWFGEIDDESILDLANQFIRTAADLGECVIAVPGAQCLLLDREDVFKVLVYAPIEKRVARVHDRHPECVNAEAFLRQMDLQSAKYTLEHYGSEWLGVGLYLYDLCVNSCMGLDAAAALINAELALLENRGTPPVHELSPCHAPQQL